jgi:hypothetical protein
LSQISFIFLFIFLEGQVYQDGDYADGEQQYVDENGNYYDPNQQQYY